MQLNIYLAILKCFLNYEIFSQYFRYLDSSFLKENYPEIFRMAQCLPHIHKEQTPGTRPISDLEITYITLYPQTPKAQYQSILAAIEASETTPTRVEEYLQELDKRTKATTLAKAALAFAEGQSTSEVLDQAIATCTISSIEDSQQDFIDDTLEAIYQKQVANPGLAWRLNSLNQALGPLRKGDFGFIFARPETGKTTFLASEITFMASQTNSPILWFNNEEQSEKVLLRCYQAALNKEVHEIFRNREQSTKNWNELCRGQIKFPSYESCTRGGIENLCKKYRPSLVIFDQIDKLTGFKGDRDDLELTAIYEWARGIAQSCGPVIGICQAGASGEGKKWLTMNDVNNSKTGKQGEADWILGIGKSLDEAFTYERYLHLSKNKLLGSLNSNSEMRHGKWTVRFLPEKARYEDIQ